MRVAVRKVAVGNQDANSVGMFGVGFYSVGMFALADRPEIHSGGTYMRFSFDAASSSSATSSIAPPVSIAGRREAGCDLR